MTLNPWRLRLLSQLDALGTVRAVAQAANLSASSVSQQLAVLESETRTQLIERTGRRVRLTSAGLILARRARSILDQMEAVEAELRGLNDEPSGLIRLGAFQSSIHTLAVPAVRRLGHPHLDVELIELEPHASMPALLAGEVDVIITTTDFVEQPVPRDIDVVPLGEDPIVLLSPPGQPRNDLAACAEEPWAFDVPGSYMANLATRLCRQAGFEPRVVGRFSNYMLTLEHVEAGLAVAVLPALAVDRRFDVVAKELPVTRRITAAVRRDSRAAITVVLDALHAVVPASGTS
ncbi:LysR substrate-binding domain-containing protein [Lentzea sp. DG1S-22]|uniref:LysR substrate-binding domain-containing protein n=1 Tax=Lentzea sp. DG1S-22 TaxID=3108822 RepID=UPI002E7A308E|nr:LysR substrate-binding domain-containing protein [Lentzea sp. DG1S-22]WVH81919.1 LysR substrate-binding domain-containing protein [Lentzea sp. DG1S-22]